MDRILVFDMDGTIADLYGVDGWLDDLVNKRTRPYAEARPLYDMDTLVTVLEILKGMGWRIAVTSWLAKNSNKAYDNAVRKVKKNWLDEYGFPYDILNIVEYGTDKSTVTERIGGFQILIDDEEKNLKDWRNGLTIDAKRDIMSVLLKMIDKDGEF